MEIKELAIFSPSKILFLSCLSFLFGIFFSSFSRFPIFLFYFFCQLFLLFFLFSHNFKFFFFSLSLLSFLFGYFWYQRALFKFENSTIFLATQVKKENKLEGVILSFLKRDYKTQKVLFLVEKFNGKPDKGKIEILLPANVPVEIGNRLLIKGTLSSPSKEFLGIYRKERILGLCFYPRVKILEKNYSPNFFYFLLLTLERKKEKIHQLIFENFSKEKAFILIGVLLGEKGKIPQDFREKIKNAGLSHIIVVSGIHFVILATIFQKIFLSLGISLRKTFLLTFIFLLVFLALIGFQPSATRAAIMIGFSILAFYFGRQYFSHRALLFAAIFMLLENPFLLREDLSFQLSFLATLGISLLFSNFQTLFKDIPNILGIRDIFSATLSAQYFSFPFLIFNFGYISLAFAISNILVLFILPYLILFGLLFLFFSSFFPLFSQILVLPLNLVLAYLLKVINFFSKPSTLLKLNFSLFELGLVYFILITLAIKIKKRESLNF